MEDRKLFAKEQYRAKVEKVDFDKQRQKCEDTILEYQEKLKSLDSRQIEAIKNLEKSEELKKILNAKIKENDATKIQLGNLQEVNRRLQRELDNRVAETINKVKRLDTAILTAKKKKEMLVFKINQQTELDKEIEVRRLRVEKLARDKGIAKELKQLEKELKQK